LSAAPALLPAATAFRPGDLEGQGITTREDARTRIATALRAWHLDALSHATLPAPNATVRPVTNCDDDGEGSLREVIALERVGRHDRSRQSRVQRDTLETGGIAVRLDSATIVGRRRMRLRSMVMLRSRVPALRRGQFHPARLTVRNGRHRATRFNVGVGGCIASAGYLTLDHSVVTAVTLPARAPTAARSTRTRC